MSHNFIYIGNYSSENDIIFKSYYSKNYLGKNTMYDIFVSRAVLKQYLHGAERNKVYFLI